MKFQARVIEIEPGTQVMTGGRGEPEPIDYMCTARGHAGTFEFRCDMEEARSLFNRLVDIEITVAEVLTP